MSHIRASACATAAVLPKALQQNSTRVSVAHAAFVRVAPTRVGMHYQAIDQRKSAAAPLAVAAENASTILNVRSLTTNVARVERDVQQIITETTLYVEELDFSHCGLTALPEGIKKFTLLKKIDLRGNGFTFLSEDILRLFVKNKSLEVIDLSDNPMWDDMLLPKYLAMKAFNPKIQIIIDSSDGPVPFLA